MDVDKIKEDLKRTGYSVLEGFFESQLIEHLREECETLRELALEQSPSSGGGGGPWATNGHSSCIFEAIPGALCERNPALRSSCTLYQSVRTTWPLRFEVWAALFAETSPLPKLVRKLLGPDAVLFNEQYIVKPCRSGHASAFNWHRDSDWCRDRAAMVPYISVWAALDDVAESNGCLRIRPGSHLPGQGSSSPLDTGEVEGQEGKGSYEKVEESETSSEDNEKGIALRLSAGSAVIMTDAVQHASGPNDSVYSRRAWMPQFSSAPIVWKENSLPVSLAISLSPPPKEPRVSP